MKRFLCIAAIIALLPLSAYGWMMMGRGTVSGGGESYPDIDFYWGFESGLTIDKSHLGDTSATLASAAAIETGFGQVGSQSLDIPTSYDYAENITVDSNADFTSGRIGCYVCFEALATAAQFWYIRDDSSNYIEFGLDDTSSDELFGRYRVGGTNVDVISTTANLQTSVDCTSGGTWYFVEFAYENTDGGTDTIEIFLDGVSQGSNTGSLSNSASTSGTIQIGSGVNIDMHLDQLLWSDDETRDLNALKSTTSFSD